MLVTADGGDYTVHIVVGVDPEGRMYVLDLWRKQSSSDEWIESFCRLIKEYKPREWAEEQGQIRAGAPVWFLPASGRWLALTSYYATAKRGSATPPNCERAQQAWT